MARLRSTCNLSNNSAPGAGLAFGAGGAIYNNGTSSGQATLNLTNTTLAENSGAFFGAGVCNDGTTNGMATATLTNCTLTGNDGGNGGAIANLGAANGHTSLVVRSSTFQGNTASFGGALYLDAQNNGNSTLVIRNTILNTGATGANFSVNNGATVTSEGHNISNDPAGGAGGSAPDGFLNGTGDKRNTDPKLDPLGLKDNGGPPPTIGLTATSPAINGAVNAPPRDQRGYVRQNTADVGAFEFGGSIPGILRNISTRALVQTGNNVLIGGIIVAGGGPKKVILRALGPTLGQPPFNVPNALANPTMELRDSTGALLIANDDWVSAANAAAISASGFAPPRNLESAILTTLNPGNYTAVVRGVNNTTGIALVEGYDLDNTAASKFGNISTRSFVGTGANVMIVGVIVQGPDSQTVIIRGLGPTLTQFGVSSVLANPFLDLRNANGSQIMTNDNWKDSQQAQIQATGYAPPNDAESAAVVTLAPGNYTAILSGVNSSTGNALVEVYSLN